MSEFVESTSPSLRYVPEEKKPEQTKQINVKELEIKDEKLVQKYMEEFKNFYIPASEHDTFDTDLINDDVIHKSTEIIGQHQPIEVAICESDLTKDSNPFHIHLRIIDGRHRWKSAIKHKVLWFTKFYNVKNYNQYMQLRGHFDTKKIVTSRERLEYFEKLGKYYEDVLGVTRNHVCTAVIKDFAPTPFNEATIRRYIPIKYKDASKQKGCYASVEKRHPQSIEKMLQKSPEAIRAKLCNDGFRINSLEEENTFLRSELGEKMIFEPMYVLEQLVNNNWQFIHSTKDIAKATKELESLDPATYRVRKIDHNYDYIYRATANEKILEQRELQKQHREHYELKKALGRKENFKNSLLLIHSILDVLQTNNKLLLHHIAREAKIPEYACELKCGELESLGLLIEVKDGRLRILMLTKEGLKFKKEFDKFADLLNKTGLELDGNLKQKGKK